METLLEPLIIIYVRIHNGIVMKHQMTLYHISYCPIYSIHCYHWNGEMEKTRTSGDNELKLPCRSCFDDLYLWCIKKRKLRSYKETFRNENNYSSFVAFAVKLGKWVNENKDEVYHNRWKVIQKKSFCLFFNPISRQMQSEFSDKMRPKKGITLQKMFKIKPLL